MHKECTVSKTFLVEIENFLYQSSPVRSTGIHVDIGEDDPSLWCLEISHRDGRGLAVSLHRLDSMQVELDAAITLDISDACLGYNVSGTVNNVRNDTKKDEACLILDDFVNEKDLFSSELFSNGTVSISCQLQVSYSTSNEGSKFFIYSFIWEN